jgi:TRAP-type C4-dicarboxylate transport system permease small subunit
MSLYEADRIVTHIIRTVSYISGACLIGIMLVAFFNVLGEKLITKGIPMSTEIVQYLHIPVVFLACAYVTLDRGQVKVDLLYTLLPKCLQTAVAIFGDVLGSFISAFVAVRGFIQTAKFIDRHTMSSVSGIGFPVWPFGIILSTGFSLLAFSFLWSIVRKCCTAREKN